ncbi:hypothetical protein HOY80DRAFT_1100640 [Tuber brumale]|nr:hypothetical protein HOY80DRAFT_1100640 [Tuber brumale]
MSSRKPCAAANCECKDFLIPKSGNLKKCADTECNHPLGAHHAITLPPARKPQTSSQHIITLDEDDEQDDDIEEQRKSPLHSSITPRHGVTETLPSRSAMTLPSQSQSSSHVRYQQLSFKDEVNFARQKAITANSQRGKQGSTSLFIPTGLSAELQTTIQGLKPIQIKTTIWTRQEGSHMVKENNTQWWDFPLEEILRDYNGWLVERILNHTIRYPTYLSYRGVPLRQATTLS